MNDTTAQVPTSHKIWDALAIASIVGIWPRFVEPNMLNSTYITLKIKDLPPQLEGLKILQFSDLHLNKNTSESFLEKVKRKAEKFEPDIVAFTGDFICRSSINEEESQRLLNFLNTFPKGKYGSFAVLGNHDYANFVSVNKEGEYAISAVDTSPIKQGFSRIFGRTLQPKAMQLNVHDVPLHEGLLSILEKTPFRLLHNSCTTVPIHGSALNIVGLGEYTLGRFDPDTAFRFWDEKYPGIVLAHNPDCAPHLGDYPGAVILSGHTHGGQVNLPLIGKKFLVVENPHLKKGIIHIHNKWLYVNRGIGGLLPFRFFAPPELLCLTLVPA